VTEAMFTALDYTDMDINNIWNDQGELERGVLLVEQAVCDARSGSRERVAGVVPRGAQHQSSRCFNQMGVQYIIRQLFSP